MRRFPAQWAVEAIKAGLKIVDADGQSIAYVYGHTDPRDAGISNSLSLDEARRIAANIAKLPSFLGKGYPSKKPRLFRDTGLSFSGVPRHAPSEKKFVR
jgi:hypothetical protein